MENIEKLKEKYKNNEYMLKRLEYHLDKILPATLENELKNLELRKERNKYLLEEQQIFIQIFLSKHNYFYLSNSSTFYQYNELQYKQVKEDDILHQLLSSISKEKILMDWKHKTKFQILKQIKERNLFQSIPETGTIQRVINMIYPSLFQDKVQAKYFLTVLGDNILKKNGDLFFLINPKVKRFLHELDVVSLNTIGQHNITSNIVTKYHDSYSFDKCRLLNISTTIGTEMPQVNLDMLCVAAYYSFNRYGNSEKMIQTGMTDELKEYTLFLKTTSPTNIIDEFLKYSIEKTEVESNINISWKNMHFIWKLYLSQFGFPNMFYSNTLKNILKERISFDELSDSFYNITSRFLPQVSEFISFWDKNILIKESVDLELDELCDLFKKNSGKNLGEQELVKLISHFYPLLEIIDGKYIANIACSLWDKSGDIGLSLFSLKEHYKLLNHSSFILVEDAYNFYLKYCRKNKREFIVNKRYFEKYIHHELGEYIEFDKFISSKWVSC
jgi:hypothetical protein